MLGAVTPAMATTQAPTLLIAHAGGGYQGQAYTNSIEALEHSYQAGFRHLEVDFSWTADGQLVCLHDWDKTFKKIFGFKTHEPLTLARFNELAEAHPGFRSCDLAALAAWLKDKPEVKIITDIKHHNLQGIRFILAHNPALQAVLIPQFYQPEEYAELKAMGFTQLIWILYQYQGSKRSVVELSAEMDLLALSMRPAQAKSRTLQKLRHQHRIFVYTINKAHTIRRLQANYGVSGFYTDFLPPD
ncbi:glycerophosphodiester phosphodiesterase family protein [Marinicella meishanensis]|uniref:glycerophosphodiester phosphodiesterase family protein n=1 Tax=Marinicella meishanensis TaxID=2873263 RepID=UPI001CC059B7|nr:glycerophosphodiester phosphodiesterase family protein [Marinicella sp. NBU2979]